MGRHTVWRAARLSTGPPSAMEDASAIPETMIDASEAIAAAGFDVDALVAALEAATGMPLPAIAAVALFVMATIFWILARVLFGGSRGKVGGGGDAVLLCGACGAGKTCMFQTLRGGSPYLTTVTSMTENEARFPVEGKSAKRGVVSKQTHLVDLPGHPRLRAMLDKHAPGARAVVFVVDAVDFTAQRRAVAEHLFAIVSDPVVQRRRLPILVACNKSEKITAHPVEFIKKRLEKEIEALRQTTGTLADTSGGEGAAAIGKPGVEFKFEHLARNDVEVAATSVAEGDLDAVRAFLVR